MGCHLGREDMHHTLPVERREYKRRHRKASRQEAKREIIRQLIAEKKDALLGDREMARLEWLEEMARLDAEYYGYDYRVA